MLNNGENYQVRAETISAKPVLEAIQTADPTDQTLNPSPYNGIQYVGIPEFQGIGTQVG